MLSPAAKRATIGAINQGVPRGASRFRILLGDVWEAKGLRLAMQSEAQGAQAPEARFPIRFFKDRPGYPWFVVGTVCVGAFMAALDASIVNVAMPTFATYFGEGINRVEWVSITYLLTLTSLVIAFGRMADLIGRRPMYTWGFLVFIVGSALCGAAPTLDMLFLARILQACGAGMLQANSVAIITATVSPGERGRAIGIQGAAQAIGLSVGPAVGGVLIGLLGWRAIFYVNVPVGILGTLAGALILPRDIVAKGRRQPFDFLGAGLIAGALLCLLYVVSQGATAGWLSPSIIGGFVLFVILGLAMVRWELQVDHPVVDPQLFRSWTFTSGNITGLLSYSVMYGVLFLMPFYLERVLHRPPATTGILLTPVALAMTVMAPLAGSLADRFGSRRLTVLGMAITTLGALALTTLDVATPFVLVIAYLALVGAGLGVFTPPNNSSVMGSAPRERLGVAGGILNMARSLGMSMGVALSGTLLATLLGVFGGSEASTSMRVLLPTFRYSFMGLVALGLIATVLTMLREPGHGHHAGGEPIDLV